MEHAALLMADWIKHNVESPLVIGPDSESEQWVAAVAARAGAPCVVAAAATAPSTWRYRI